MAASHRENTGINNHQDVAGIAAMADVVIINEGTKAELIYQVITAYNELNGASNGTS
jgi:hypothetical protein